MPCDTHRWPVDPSFGKQGYPFVQPLVTQIDCLEIFASPAPFLPIAKNRTDALEISTQKRHTQISTILEYVDNEQLLEELVGMRLEKQLTDASQDDSPLEPEVRE